MLLLRLESGQGVGDERKEIWERNQNANKQKNGIIEEEKNQTETKKKKGREEGLQATDLLITSYFDFCQKVNQSLSRREKLFATFPRFGNHMHSGTPYKIRGFFWPSADPVSAPLFDFSAL